MKKRKWLLSLCMGAVLALCGAFAACGEGGKDPDPETPDPGVTEPTDPVYALTLTGATARTLEVNGAAGAKGSDTLAWTVTKDGTAVTTETVTVSVSGSAVSYSEADKTVTAVAVGKATVTLSLDGHSEVSPVGIAYTVNDYFFQRAENFRRGDLNFSGEASGQVQINGGQAVLLTEQKATKWVFRTTLKPVDYTSSEAFGVGSFLDNGNHALWFGLRNTDEQSDGKFDVLQQDFYTGWAGVETFPEGYRNRAFDLSAGIPFEIVRDGDNYYYSIATYYGSYTAAATGETFPGIFAQNRVVSVTNFSVSYDEEEVETAAAAYATKGIASVSIKETTKTRLIKGASQQYTASVYPAGKEGTVKWSLDKEEMTAGLEGTTVGEESGLLQLANDAAGKVTLICEAGTARDTLVITILSESEFKENAQLSVKGGVLLESNGDIVFPEYMMSTDGIGDEESYTEAPEYGATLKQKVQGDFTVSFTVSEYKENASNPKLMISLGGTHNQFYIVYNDNTTFRVETFTESVSPDGGWFIGRWVNSDGFADFDASKPHTFTIEVKNGRYNVKLDGSALAFHDNDQENDGTARPRSPVRKYADYSTEQSIRFSTHGVSARVSSITVTNGTAFTPVDYFGYCEFEKVGTNGVNMEFLSTGDWDKARNRVIRTAATPEGDFTLTMDIVFDTAMKDAKAIVNLGGNKEYHFCNKISGGQLYLELVNMDASGEFITWSGQTDHNIPYEEKNGTYTIALRIERSGKTNRIIANGVELCRPECEIGTNLRLSVFNNEQQDANAHVRFENITFDEYEESKIYTVENLNRSLTLNVDAEEELSFEVHCNNNKMSEGFEVEVTTEEGKEFVSYEQGKLKALAVGEEDVTIAVKVGGQVVCTAVVHVAVINRPTADSNENWTVKGGVVLYTDDDSIEFPEAHQGTNGVGDGNGEYNYTDNDYSANYKHTVIGNFSIKFTVSNYKVKAGVDYPKLMISLGGVNEQFYVVYNREGHVNRIETYTKSIDADGNPCVGQWVSSGEFAAFDTNAPHTFEIKVVSGGYYEVYLDDTKVEGFNMDGGARTSFRRYEDYTTEQPIRISTNGVSCTVSNIVVTNGTADDVKTSGTEHANWFTHSDNHISAVTDDGFTMGFAKHAWTARDDYKNRMFYTGTVAQYFTAEFDLVISDWMTDTKFGATFGNYHVMIDIKVNVIKCNVAPGTDDWGENDIPGATVGSAIHIKVVNAEDGFKVYSGASGENLIHTKAAATTVSPLSFWAFCNEDGRDSVTATVSDLTIS